MQFRIRPSLLRKSMKRALNLKDNLEPYCVITFGYSKESKITRRKSLDIFIIK